MGNKDESLASLFFRLALAASEEEHDPKVAKGESPEDFIYEKAERVVHSSIPGYVTITFLGREYGGVKITWGALDGDVEKSTGLIKTYEGLWYKLWFYNSEIEPAQ